MAFDKFGTLIINASAAGGALPVRGTVVRITGGSEENKSVEYSLVTDWDGVTEILSLPAPSRELSLHPGAKEPSYALYDIQVSAPGYYTKKIYNVAVFEGTETIQPVNMIPMAIYENNVTYPRNNLDTFVSENEMLE